ncbi:helix-turn-helix domain-containing protein [Bacillus sp. FJAT-49705]|uniref:Helix-turn-helix domain-containing protein n=1 Tax=Cytobacillus citreus TaxID=2833586 RepID=A0ABS5NRX0_9BACI|nr:helix-turn-helix domain-containing protein [Cytobacillus citreus]MBS4190537.1 helix-turn-helix domain-containing protein [Cytobacillus citreus]
MSHDEIEKLIYDYHWLRKEVSRLEKIIFGFSVPIKSLGAAQYGIEAALPKGSPLKSAAELEALDLREKRLYKRLNLYRVKVFAIEKIAELYLVDDQELILIDCMMEGMSYRAIAAHLGVSREKVRSIKNEMIDHIYQNCHFLHELKLDKSAM